jgi:flagellar biosynthesis protein FliQ
MNAEEIIEIGREAIWLVIKVGGPVLLISLLVGFIISLFQALTQMQEMTLSFVPKIIVIFVSMMLLLPYMVATLTQFAHRVMERIVN